MCVCVRTEPWCSFCRHSKTKVVCVCDLGRWTRDGGEHLSALAFSFLVVAAADGCLEIVYFVDDESIISIFMLDMFDWLFARCTISLCSIACCVPLQLFSLFDSVFKLLLVSNKFHRNYFGVSSHVY